VGYTYQIATFEVTAVQYTAFLNAVAGTDPYGLYNVHMDYDADPSGQGCNIKRTGDLGSYTYSVASDWANRPVNYVSWGDAARFANWLSNGQPTGTLTGDPVQDGWLTEDGSYALDGAMTDAALLTITRKPNARYAIPTEDEWFKAAYYDPNKPGGAGYWGYPTRADSWPSNVLSSTGTNNANYDLHDPYNPIYTIGAPYWRTEVGAFASSPSPYGTFDQGGNVWEWNEALLYGTSGTFEYRGVRGGAFATIKYFGIGINLHAVDRTDDYPTNELGLVGFRLVTGHGPTVTQQPIGRSIMLGDTAVFSVQAEGTPSLAYRWQKNQVDLTDGGPFSGALTPTLTVTNASGAAEAGAYRCAVTNTFGSTTSTEATLTIRAPDYDGDLDADLNDFSHMQLCLGTVDTLVVPDCANADLNNDLAVNFGDVHQFMNCMSGPRVPVALDCLDRP
jgi:formylglycine-generating enzyme required for sulfatase activity